MYKVFFKGTTIYDPRGKDRGYVITDPDIHLAVGESGSFAFNIYNDHPNAARLTKLDGVLELYAGPVRIYKGRVMKDTLDFDLTRRIETEGLLACLNDSVIPPFNFPEDFQEDAAYLAAAENGNVIRFFLEWVLAEHNSQVGPAQQIQLGDVTVVDPNNYISRASSDYLTSMEVVKKKLAELLGGYLLPDYSGDTTVLHYYADLPLTNMQPVEFGENLLDLVNLVDATEVYTAILPVGKDGLTIEELPDVEIAPGYFKQGKIIYSQETETKYNGVRIVRKVVWDDVTLASNLQTKALTQLSTDGVKLAQTITAKAADLGGGDVSRFVVGRYVDLRSTPHGFSAAYPLMELEPNIFDPGDTIITLGATLKTSTGLANESQDAYQEQLDKIQTEINTQAQGLIGLEQETERKITETIQTSNSIINKALEEYVKTSNYDQFKQTVSSQFEQTAKQISASFSEVTEQVNVVNGDLQKIVQRLEKHFDFGLTGLIIRAGVNDMSLRLDNGLVLFEKNGQTFGWWDGVDFHTGSIYIGLNEKAQFGDFALVPRSNRSLSFLHIEEING